MGVNDKQTGTYMTSDRHRPLLDVHMYLQERMVKQSSTHVPKSKSTTGRQLGLTSRNRITRTNGLADTISLGPNSLHTHRPTRVACKCGVGYPRRLSSESHGGVHLIQQIERTEGSIDQTSNLQKQRFGAKQNNTRHQLNTRIIQRTTS